MSSSQIQGASFPSAIICEVGSLGAGSLTAPWQLPEKNFTSEITMDQDMTIISAGSMTSIAEMDGWMD